MKSNVRFFLVIAIGAVVGSILNELCARAGAPGWLVNKLTMGLDPPFCLDLVVFRATIGLTLSMSLASVLGMLIALIAFHRRL